MNESKVSNLHIKRIVKAGDLMNQTSPVKSVLSKTPVSKARASPINDVMTEGQSKIGNCHVADSLSTDLIDELKGKAYLSSISRDATKTEKISVVTKDLPQM